VHYQGDVVNVNPSCCDVGRDQRVEPPTTQGLERSLARTLWKVAVDRQSLETRLAQRGGEPIGTSTGSAEHHRGTSAADRLGRHLDSGGCIDSPEVVLNATLGLRSSLDDVTLRLVAQLARQSLDRRIEGGGKEEGLASLGGLRGQPAYLGPKAHVGHAVDFVHDEDTHGVETNVALLDEIPETARRRHHHVGVATQRCTLRPVADPTVDDGDALAELCGERCEGVMDLLGQLPRGSEHEPARAAPAALLLGLDPCEEDDAKGEGLSGASRRGADDITPGETIGNGRDLNRGRSLDPALGKSRDNGGRNPELGKRRKPTTVRNMGRQQRQGKAPHSLDATATVTCNPAKCQGVSHVSARRQPPVCPGCTEALRSR